MKFKQPFQPPRISRIMGRIKPILKRIAARRGPKDQDYICVVKIQLHKTHINKAQRIARHYEVAGHEVLEMACIKGLDLPLFTNIPKANEMEGTE